MAHELAFKKDGRAAMAFVGQTPWHGLGQSVTKGASIGVWQREAGMDWEAKEASLRYDLRNPDPTQKGWIEFDGYKGLYRSDTLEPLSVVSAKYQPVQPREVLEFFRDLIEQGGWHIHTAGVLRGGRKLWAMASNDQSAIVGAKGQKDEVAQNLLLATSLDGSMKTTAMMTSVRVVCANTLSLATQANKPQIHVSHRSMFEPQVIKRALGVSQDSFSLFMNQAQEMAETPIKLDEALEVLRDIFGGPKSKKAPNTAWLGSLKELGTPTPDEDVGKESRTISRVLELFAGGAMGSDLKSSKGTRWGLLNAITQHVDHEMGRTDDTRLDSAWFGRGAGFKAEALKELTVTS